ncbi:MAG: hypothetical protein NPINA01_22890 [Nitrospinaceae bacterium]|nr:MAG: hypothetical protein NPINA01_22890 [Nitrospinaceae bacterium]
MMRTAFLFLVFLATFLTATPAAPSVENESGTVQHVRDEIKELERKQVQFPFDADLYFILGNNYWTLNDKEKAIENFQRAVLLNPDYSSAHWSLSVIYNRMEDGKNAILHMKKAEEIFSKTEDVKSLASARKMLRGYFAKYEYQPEDFEARKGFLWRIFN